MSPAYMEETANAMKERGFALELETWKKDETPGGPGATGRRYILNRGNDERLVLESVNHPDEGDSYFLEIERFHGLRCFSFPLDSWKHFPNRVEFKFYALAETSLGLSFILDFPED